MNNRHLKIGTDDFRKLRSEGGYFVDKSSMIREVIDGSTVTLLPRPRRFGKTLNLSMLRYFFRNDQDDNVPLFDGLQIAGDLEAMSHQGRYPVIFITLKKIKGEDWTVARDLIVEKVSMIYKESRYVLSSLAEDEREQYERLVARQGSKADLVSSLANLISHLYHYHKQPVVVLIDEYDTPVIEAWKGGYYDQMIDFLRSWLGDALKHEEGMALYRAVITGILRVAKESLFSGLNNLKVASTLVPGPFADKFGFTQQEVDRLLEYFELPELSGPIREWYNGYDFGGVTIYNPWSVVNAADNHPGPLCPHWLNTASNQLVYEELEAGGAELKRDLQKLLNHEEIRYPLNESIIFADIGRGAQNIWSFLYFSGYLKADNPQTSPLNRYTLTWRLRIPNGEVEIAYRQFIERIYNAARPSGTQALLDCFIEDYPADEYERVLQDLIMSMTSYHDTARWPEAVFHAFVLGLLASLREVYEIRSNPETGYGRADILMKPKTTAYPLAYVIEFKALKMPKARGNASPADQRGTVQADSDKAARPSFETTAPPSPEEAHEAIMEAARETALEEAIAEAFQQIEARNYQAALNESGVSPENIRKIAFVLCGRRVMVAKN